MPKPGTTKAIRERAKKSKAKSETERVALLHAVDRSMRNAARGRALSDKDVKKFNKMIAKKK
jgi:hypothetical protein